MFQYNMHSGKMCQYDNMDREMYLHGVCGYVGVYLHACVIVHGNECIYVCICDFDIVGVSYEFVYEYLQYSFLLF